jgi:hypothetical protein
VLVATLFLGLAEIDGAGASKTPPSPFTAKVALDPHVQARAKQTVIRPRDLPKGWEVDPTWSDGEIAKKGPAWSCNGHTADLSALVVHGAWSTRTQLVSPSGDPPSFVTSDVVVLASVKQAQALFDVDRTYYPKYCEILRKVQPRGVVVYLSRLHLPRVAEQQAGFLTTFLTSTSLSWEDFVVLRRGRVLGELAFFRPGKAFPTRLENAVIEKFAARLHA